MYKRQRERREGRGREEKFEGIGLCDCGGWLVLLCRAGCTLGTQGRVDVTACVLKQSGSSIHSFSLKSFS